MTSKLTP